MSLAQTLDRLALDLSTPAAARAYAATRLRHPALFRYETIASVLAATKRGTPMSSDERDAIFGAIASELQITCAPVWRSMLLTIFTSMLVRLRSSMGRRLRKDDPESENLDQRVVLAFLETASTLTFRTYIARNLWLLTRARLFDERRRERRAPPIVAFEEAAHSLGPSRVEVQQRAAAAEIVRIIEAEWGEDLRDLLLETSEGEDSVREYVDRAYADCNDRVRARVSKRLRRARLEVFAKLRVRAERQERRRLLQAA